MSIKIKPLLITDSKKFIKVIEEYHAYGYLLDKEIEYIGILIDKGLNIDIFSQPFRKNIFAYIINRKLLKIIDFKFVLKYV